VAGARFVRGAVMSGGEALLPPGDRIRGVPVGVWWA
jgi:hypothetical protein